MKNSVEYLSSIYKVYPKKHIYELKGHEYCGHHKIPREHRKHGVFDYDLVVYVATKEGVGNIKY